MKKISIIMIAVLSIAVSCKSKKGAKTTTDKNSGMEIINLPCDEFQSSTTAAFRATQSQRSSDLSLSREKALVVAKQRLAGLVQTSLNSVGVRYINEYQKAAALDLSAKYENETREIIKQQLSDVKILCEKTVKEQDGSYTTFVAVEMSKDALKTQLENNLSDKTKLDINYDKMKFEQIYNEEMKKLDDAKK